MKTTKIIVVVKNKTRSSARCEAGGRVSGWRHCVDVRGREWSVYGAVRGVLSQTHTIRNEKTFCPIRRDCFNNIIFFSFVTTAAIRFRFSIYFFAILNIQARVFPSSLLSASNHRRRRWKVIFPGYALYYFIANTTRLQPLLLLLQLLPLLLLVTIVIIVIRRVLAINYTYLLRRRLRHYLLVADFFAHVRHSYVSSRNDVTTAAGLLCDNNFPGSDRQPSFVVQSTYPEINVK